MDTNILHQFLTLAVQKGVSDILFQVASQPLFRVHGSLVEVKYHPLSAEETHQIAALLLGVEDVQMVPPEVKEIDCSYGLSDIGRFRANIFKQRGSYGIVLRVIPPVIKTFAQLNLPAVLEDISNLRRGLVMITGATGNGKTTTLASMINYLNRTRKAHIITIEDPIEFLFKNEMSVVTQREIGSDTESFNSALRSALRQNPDVIAVGEMRDAETAEIALKAAETGHLVLGTIHTPDVQQTIARLVAFFPGNDDVVVRARLAETLKAIISLRLVVSKQGQQRYPVCEIMRVTKTIEECIKRPERTGEIHDYMSKARDFGMQTFDQHLIELVKNDLITAGTAKVIANKPDDIERMMLLE